MRVAFTWAKRSLLYDTDLQMNQLKYEDEGALDLLVDTIVSDWDICNYDSEGKEIDWAKAENGNVEIVALDPAVTENYTITKKEWRDCSFGNLAQNE